MTKPNFSLQGKVAIVTGAKRGMGREIALTFAEAGADVAVCGRFMKDGQLEAVAGEIRKLGRRSLAIEVDISVKAQVDHAVQKAIDEFGRIDILVNNAAILIKRPILEFSEDDYDRLMDTDLKGYFLFSQAAGKRMAERHQGVIVNIASNAGLQYTAKIPGLGIYSVAKAGVIMLTTALAKELGPYGIRANAIAPTSTRTPMSIIWSSPEAEKDIASSIPLGRAAEPADQAAAALFLASDAASLISGVTLRVDGGQLG